MKKKFLLLAFFGMAVLSFWGCSTSAKAVASLNSNDGFAVADFQKKVPTVTLNNGVEMPIFGMGTYRITDFEECERAVS
jgi:outer membrane protease